MVGCAMKPDTIWKSVLAWTVALVPAASVCAGSLTVQVVDKNGQPAGNAVVTIEMPAAKPVRAQNETVTIGQEKMQFVPEVTLVKAQTRLRFVNNDPWDHHIRAQLAGVNAFMSEGRLTETRVAGKQEGRPASYVEIAIEQVGPVQLGCHLHGSMRGFVFFTDTPHAGKTGADGSVVIDNLPDGTALLRVWHPDQLIELPSQAVQISGAKSLQVKLSVVPRRRRI